MNSDFINSFQSSEKRTVVVKHDEKLIFVYEKNEFPIEIYNFAGKLIDIIEPNYTGTIENVIKYYRSDTIENMKTVLKNYSRIIKDIDFFLSSELGHTHENGVLNNWFFKNFPIDVSALKAHLTELEAEFDLMKQEG